MTAASDRTTQFLGATDIGCRRKSNEDVFATSKPGAPFAWGLVCDGMGGAAAGEVASALASELLARRLAELATNELGADALLRLAREANDLVFEASKEPGRWGMGTTLVAVVLDATSRRGWTLHAGDSRAYRLHGNEIARLTDDHNWGEELRRAGITTPPGARVSQEAAALTRVLGMEEFPSADVAEIDLAPGDRLLLSSDGFTGLHGDGEIGSILAEGSVASVPARAIASSRARGGPDNITVVVAEIVA